MPKDPIIGNQLRFSRMKSKTLARRAATKKPRPMQHPSGITLLYTNRILLFVKEWERLYRSIVDPQLESLAQKAYVQKPIQAGTKTDAWPDDLELLINQLALNIDDTIKDIESLALNIGQKTSEWNNTQWRKTMISVMGVDLFTQEPWLVDQIKSFAKQNVGLIKDISTQTVANVNQVITDGFQRGMRIESIRKEILSKSKLEPGRFKKSATRAKLIARDQVAKMNGQLTQLRQEEIGVGRYTWRSSYDERVRQSHKNMNGRICRWDDATVVLSRDGKRWIQRSSINGINKHPGQDYQCRCTPEPMLEDLYTKKELKEAGLR